MKKAFIFDFDDTLATTTARVIVMRDNGYLDQNDDVVAYLAPKEFSRYELEEGEYFDFTEFCDAQFIQDADATFLMGLAEQVDREGHDIYILTARDDDSSEAIRQFLADYGVRAKGIHCVGGRKETISKRKHDILMMLIRQYDKCYFYDDCPNNIANAPVAENFRKYQV